VDSVDEFEQHACLQLQQNEIGERSLYRYGDSLIQLMYSYTMDQPYRQFRVWKENTNRVKTRFFCFHSDVAFSYFANYYRVAHHAGANTTTAEIPFYYDEDRILGYHGSLEYYGEPEFANEQKDNAGIAEIGVQEHRICVIMSLQSACALCTNNEPLDSMRA